MTRIKLLALLFLGDSEGGGGDWFGFKDFVIPQRSDMTY